MVGKRVNTSKSEAMILTVKVDSPHWMNCFCRWRSAGISGFFFMSEGRLERNTNRWISKVTTVLKTNMCLKKSGSPTVVSVLVQVP